MTNTQWSTLHETVQDLTPAAQRRTLERTVRHTDGHKIRVAVVVDSTYLAQSRFTAELWTGTAWSNIVNILGDDVTVTAESVSMHGRDASAKRAYLDRIATELLTRAAAVLA